MHLAKVHEGPSGMTRSLYRIPTALSLIFSWSCAVGDEHGMANFIRKKKQRHNLWARLDFKWVRNPPNSRASPLTSMIEPKSRKWKSHELAYTYHHPIIPFYGLRQKIKVHLKLLGPFSWLMAKFQIEHCGNRPYSTAGEKGHRTSGKFQATLMQCSPSMAHRAYFRVSAATGGSGLHNFWGRDCKLSDILLSDTIYKLARRPGRW